MSETLDLTIIGGQLAGTTFTPHTVPSEAVFKGAKDAFAPATRTIRR